MLIIKPKSPDLLLPGQGNQFFNFRNTLSGSFLWMRAWCNRQSHQLLLRCVRDPEGRETGFHFTKKVGTRYPTGRLQKWVSHFLVKNLNAVCFDVFFLTFFV